MEQFGLKIHVTNPMEKVKGNDIIERSFHGNPWYNILTEPKYVEWFGYVGPHVKDRHKLIKDNIIVGDTNNEKFDLVLLLLNLPFIPIEVMV